MDLKETCGLGLMAILLFILTIFPAYIVTGAYRTEFSCIEAHGTNCILCFDNDMMQPLPFMPPEKCGDWERWNGSTFVYIANYSVGDKL